MNKTQLVLKHLKEGKSITSWEAIEKFGATRLSAIIFELKKKCDIKDIWVEDVDRYGNFCKYKKYFIAQQHKPKNFFQKLRTWGK
jgi:hypothetical protein